MSEVTGMSTAVELMRSYSKPDDLMLEQAQTMHDLLTLDLTYFTAEFTNISASFLSNFQSAINAAYAIPSSTDEYNQLEVLTEDVELIMENARKHYQKLITYVKMIYPDSIAKQSIFWADRYSTMRRNQTKMIELLFSCFTNANSTAYKSSLIAEGFLQSDIDQLETLHDELVTANRAQEELRLLLKVKTEDRIIALNLVWSFMSKISNASKQVFPDSYAKQQLYLLYPERNGESVPVKVQNLQFDKLNTKLKWDPAAGAVSYELEFKQDLPSMSWAILYEGEHNEFLYNVPVGVWLFRCRGENDAGKGSWSNELQVIEE